MNKRKMVALVLFLIGLVVIGGSIGSLAMLGIERSQYLIYSDSGSSSHFTYSGTLEPDHKYQIIVDMHADYYFDYYYDGYEAIVEGTVAIYVDTVVQLNEDLYDYEWRDEESSGVDAWDSVTYEFTPTSSVNVTIVGDITSGDDWTIEIYRDVPEELDLQIGVQAIFLISGLVMLVIGSGMFLKARQTS